MNNNQITCNSERIELFLGQQLSDEEQTSFESHLDDCDDCRRRLEATAARDDIWSGVRDALSGEQLPPDCLPSGASAVDSATGGNVSFSHDTILNLLGPTDDDRMIGRLGTYEVVGVIGWGGMGVVLKAFDAALNRYVAIKVLAPHLGSSGAARKRFSREAQAAAAVVHDNVIEIHGVADVDGLPYLVMPYVRGPSLQRRLDCEGPLALVETLRIGIQAASGLAAAHAQGLVHRDVKPANILLADGVERVKLTDFGLARAADDATLTKTGIIAGTPQYMSPEQARGDSVGQRSDLFSLGSVLYAMCTGRAPFRAETCYGVLRRITDEEPRPIREINPDIPEWLCHIIARLMAKQSDERFESAREVADLLEECLAHVQQPTTVPLPHQRIAVSEKSEEKRVLPAERTMSNIRRSPLFKFLIGAAFAFALMFAGILIVLELNKGTLTIQCDADNVPVRITQGDKAVEELTVSKTGASVRVAAGRYVVEIEGAADGITVENGTVKLQRGGREVVKIVKRATRPEVADRDLATMSPTDDELSGYRDFLWSSLRSLQHRRNDLLSGILGCEQDLVETEEPVEIPEDAAPEVKEQVENEEKTRASKIAGLSERIEALRAELDPVEKQLDLVKKKMDELPAAGTADEIAFDAEIVAVSDDRVEISVGSEDGVQMGMRFPVFRDEDYLGSVEIVTAEADKSSARILSEDVQTPIRRGDRATMLVDSVASRIIGQDPGELIYNDRLKRFKFRLEKIAVTEPVQIAADFWLRYRGRGNPQLTGVLGDPRTNSLVVVGPPEADQAIRDTIAEWEGFHSTGIPIHEDESLEGQHRELQNRRRNALELVVQRELEIIEAQARKEPDEEELARLNRSLEREKAEVEIIERKLEVISASIERLQRGTGSGLDL